MSRLNSLSGLNKVSVDFRPVINDPIAAGTSGVNQPQEAPEIIVNNEEQQAKLNETRNVIQKLDVLLLNAASRSIAASAAKDVMKTVGDKLAAAGVINDSDAAKLDNLAKDAAAKLAALDRFSGREIAMALTEKKNELVWRKAFFFLDPAAKAVKAAIEAQEALSEALGKLNDRIAKSDKVDAGMQDAFTELQFQCDRRVTEIYSVAVRMHDVVLQDAANGTVPDAKVTAMLDARFNELMPREAILMHGTAEAVEKMGESLGPLVGKLADFATDGGKTLDARELAAIQDDIRTMKSAIENVRRNGYNEKEHEDGGKTFTTRTEVDQSLLLAMDNVLDNASAKLADVKKTFVENTRQAFLKEVKASLRPEDASGGFEALGSNIHNSETVANLIQMRDRFFAALDRFLSDKDPPPIETFDKAIASCVQELTALGKDHFTARLTAVGFNMAAAKTTAKTLMGIKIVAAQFKEMMISTQRLLDSDEDMGIATGDVRRVLLGENTISSLVESKARGFKPEDVAPAADEANVVDSRPLGSGIASSTYMLTTKSGEEFVFKPELDGRTGLNKLNIGNGAYLDTQNVANLNFATQETAKAFKCEDIVVKYSVGSHDEQFGVFMEKAKGYTGNDFADKKSSGGEGIPPSNLHTLGTSPKFAIKGDVARKLNRLMWLDLITGQGDRHWNNYFIHIDEKTREVTLKAIDNDASFSETRIGLLKFAPDAGKAQLFEEALREICRKLHGTSWMHELMFRVLKDPAIKRNGDNTIESIDLGAMKSPEVGMAAVSILGVHSVALPEEIDKDFYDVLMEMDKDSAKKQAYLDSIKPRISPAALAATRTRLDEAIEHAKSLAGKGKVYGNEKWHTMSVLGRMTPMAKDVKITKLDGTSATFTGNIKFVEIYIVRKCPSYFMRDYFDEMFNKP